MCTGNVVHKAITHTPTHTHRRPAAACSEASPIFLRQREYEEGSGHRLLNKNGGYPRGSENTRSCNIVPRLNKVLKEPAPVYPNAPVLQATKPATYQSQRWGRCQALGV